MEKPSHLPLRIKSIIYSGAGQFLARYRFPILLTLFTRIGFSLWMALVWIVVDKYYPLTPDFLRAAYHGLTRSTTLIERSVIDVWLRWDAIHYMNIAEFGYKGVEKADNVFFPLYPYTVSAISKIFNINVIVAGLLISSLFTLFALIFFYDLIKLLFKDETLARLSLASLALFPAAFFLHAPYTEGMFLFFTIGCILLLEKRKFILGGIFACAAGLVRPQGLLLIIPVCYSLFREYKYRRETFHWKEVLSLCILPLGFLFYSASRIINGEPELLRSFQTYSNVSFRNPFYNLIQIITVFVKQPSGIHAIYIFPFIFMMCILIWMFSKKQFREHLGIMLFSACTWLLIASKTSSIGFVQMPLPRYDLWIFFAFAGIGFLLQKLSAKQQKLIFTFSIALSLVFSTLYCIGIYVG